MSQQPKVQFLAQGTFPGASRDLSGLDGRLETDTPADQLGGFSGIEYSGRDNSYFVLSDRGAGDGAASYAARFHLVDLDINLVDQSITPTLTKTVFLKTGDGKNLSGALTALEQIDPAGGTLALDAEGIRLIDGKTLAISEEYGPSVSLFSLDGKRIQRTELPDGFALASTPSALEARGTYPNRGLEGLAINNNGKTMVAVMQGALIQDGEVEGQKCLGLNTRWIVFTKDALPRQLVYRLTDESTGVSEILAVDDSRYLVLERDSNAGEQAQVKHIYLVETRLASDVSNCPCLGRLEVPQGVVATDKHLLIDLQNDRYGLAGEHTAEKPEGMCWGPNLADGRRMLIICVDNDFEVERPSEFYAFAIAL